MARELLKRMGRIGGVAAYDNRVSVVGTTIDVLHTLTPIVVVMAGADEFDPYKD